MSISKPEIVLIGGGWHYPKPYAKFRTALESQVGLTVHVPQLPTMNGSRPPNADLYADSDAIRQLVTDLADAGHFLVVIMHSYGGQVGTNALVGLGAEARKQQGLSGGVIQLIYIGAHALQEGKSGMSIAEQAGRAHWKMNQGLLTEQFLLFLPANCYRFLDPSISTSTKPHTSIGRMV